jgi:hypothetical protein
MQQIALQKDVALDLRDHLGVEDGIQWLIFNREKPVDFNLPSEETNKTAK